MQGDLVLNDNSFCERFDQALASAEAKTPFITTERHAISYADLGHALSGVYKLFRSHDLEPGSHIGILATEPVDVSVLALGGLRAGVAFSVLNVNMNAADLARAVKACDLDRVFVEDGVYDADVSQLSAPVTTFATHRPKRARKGLLGRLSGKRAPDAVQTLSDMVEDLPEVNPPTHVAPDGLAVLLYTSGTTGQPKVVQLTQANIAAQLDIFDEVFDYGPGCRILNPLAMHFTDGLCHGPLATFFSGASLYRPTRTDFSQMEDLLNSIYRDEITHFIVVPAILALIDRLGEQYADTFETGNFRYIRSSGDRLPAPLWEAIESRFKVPVVNTYGMSETVCEACFSGPSDDLRKVGTVGKAVGCDWRIVDEAGADVALGGVGELRLKGAIITPGYRGAPDLTAENIIDGWLRTGDLACADENGFITIVGRQKNLIISGGVNINPQEVSDCLLTCPGIADAIAFGVEHNVWGEQVAAAVVLREDAQVQASDVISHCQAHLEANKVPRIINFFEELPRNPAGKVLVKELKSLAAAKDVSAGSLQEGNWGAQVIEQAAEVFGAPKDELRLNSKPATTRGWDSFAHLTLIAALETRFGVTFTAQEVLRVSTLGAIVDVLKDKARETEH